MTGVGVPAAGWDNWDFDPDGGGGRVAGYR